MEKAEAKKEIPGLKIEPSEGSKEVASFETTYPLKQAASLDAAYLSTWRGNKPLKGLMDEIREAPETKLSQVGRVETKYFDSSFVDALEDGMAAIAKIVSNPRTFIKEEAELVNSEKAKKVSPVSIQHFASHSHAFSCSAWQSHPRARMATAMLTISHLIARTSAGTLSR